jgi:hypothetical protein
MCGMWSHAPYRHVPDQAILLKEVLIWLQIVEFLRQNGVIETPSPENGRMTNHSFDLDLGWLP